MRRIVWDEAKDRSNRRKHAVSFAEASDVFFDPLAETTVDLRHPVEEMRFFSLGPTRAKRLLAVAHTDDENSHPDHHSERGHCNGEETV